MTTTIAFISFDVTQEADSDIIIVVSDRASMNGVERLLHIGESLGSPRQFYKHVQFNADADSARAAVIAHALDRRAQRAALAA